MTREELVSWMLSMIPEDMDFLEQSGASYGPGIRRLEAVVRPLWGVLPLLCGQDSPPARRCFARFHELVRERALPTICRETRQIVVETGVISYGLGIYKERFLSLFTEEEQAYLIDWLGTVDQVELPENNWLFFRVLLNTALKVNGLSWSKERLEEDLAKIHSWYLGDGWYADGDTAQRDYYVAFGFHYYGMLYARMVGDEHAALFIHRARAFAKDFLYWSDPAGRTLPFGRSLTYRFAHVSFWCAFLLSGAWEGTALTIKICKGLICRNLEFWREKPICQPGTGNPTIGYGYGNLLLSEDYNAPGSPFWSFKTFSILELPAGHPFWSLEAAPYPPVPPRICQPHGGFIGIVGKESRQHVFLSASQYGANPYLYHGQEKYGKFAYSTYFGFNLTRDIRHIRQFAVDNALALSIRGHEQYTAREKILASKIFEHYAVSWWETPFARVCSYLVPLDVDVHVRIHQVESSWALDAVEGSFPVFAWSPKTHSPLLFARGVRLKTRHGSSQIIDLLGERTPEAVPQGPNTNLYSCEPNGVPALRAALTPGRHTLACALWGICGEGAVGTEEQVDLTCIEQGWRIGYRGRQILVYRMEEGAGGLPPCHDEKMIKDMEVSL